MSTTVRSQLFLPAAVDAGREGVATHAELIAAGMAKSTIMWRIQPGGRWQRLLPGVVLMHSGRPTGRERLLGALAYAGPDSVLTGMSALRLYGLRTADSRRVHVLVPHDRRRQSHAFATVERTRYLPTRDQIRTVGLLPTANLARAVVDASRRMENLNDVRNLVADAVQNHGLALSDLADAVADAARRATANGRRVLHEVGVGVRFAAETKAREVLRAAGMLEPLYNVEVLDQSGSVITCPDGYYPRWACGYQVDSRRWHLHPEAYERTVAQRAYAARFGILLLAVTPQTVFERPQEFVADLSGLIATASSRVVPQLDHRVRQGK